MDWRTAALIDFYIDQGSDPTKLDYIAAGSAILGPILALVGIYIAVKARQAADKNLKVAQDSLEIARDALEISKVEHEVFLKNYNARSDLQVTVTLMDSTDDNRAIEGATSAMIRWRITLTNQGDRTATDVHMNFLLPRTLQRPEWTSENGGPPPEGRMGGPFDAEEMLPIPTGELPSHRMDRVINRVGPRGITEVRMYVTAGVGIPQQAGESVHLPVIARAWCEEQPEDNRRCEHRYDSTVTNGTPA